MKIDAYLCNTTNVSWMCKAEEEASHLGTAAAKSRGGQRGVVRGGNRRSGVVGQSSGVCGTVASTWGQRVSVHSGMRGVGQSGAMGGAAASCAAVFQRDC